MALNSNCKKCPYFVSKKCDGKDANCICRFCPRNLGLCVVTKWCKETESAVIFE
ncbi:MAG: hypothetical protein N2486_02665 [Caloramator sp.]|nr:hypothetical protein [Caloramator sp.]